MLKNWLVAYDELKEYVARNPKIDIGKDFVAIPKDLKPEFYRLFTDIRVTFIKNNFSSLLSECDILSKEYADVKDEVARLLKLDNISIPSDLHRFLDNPTNEFISILFDPFFDLLKGNMDIGTFKQTASNNIEELFKRLYHQGYQQWVALALITLLTPDKAFRVPIDDFDVEASNSERTDGGDWRQILPSPEEARYLSFEHSRPSTFIVPDIIIHSTTTDQYLSIRTDLQEAVWISISKSDKREWFDVGSIRRKFGYKTTWPDIVVYENEKHKGLSLIADYERFYRPDIIIECMEQRDWYRQEELERMKLHLEVLKPRMGSYIVSRGSVPEKVLTELKLSQVSDSSTEGEVDNSQILRHEHGSEKDRSQRVEAGIYLLNVGFNKLNLRPIVSVLVNRKMKK